jgi:hypothetical protein
MSRRKPLFVPCYFGPIDQFAYIVQHDSILFESSEHYQKQSFRNRQEISSANGKLKLSIPIKHIPGKKNTHQVLKDVRIENDFKWQKEHFRSMQIAYQTAPFFEFFEDDLRPLYQTKYTYLMDFDLACFDTLCHILDLPIAYETTQSYSLQKDDHIDQRNLAEAKRAPSLAMEEYDQVFMERHGFMSNLSILDLVFNLGNASTAYLKGLTKGKDLRL